MIPFCSISKVTRVDSYCSCLCDPLCSCYHSVYMAILALPQKVVANVLSYKVVADVCKRQIGEDYTTIWRAK
jgi:hypothetical protein